MREFTFRSSPDPCEGLKPLQGYFLPCNRIDISAGCETWSRLLYNRIVNKFARFVGIFMLLFGLLAGTGNFVHAQEAGSKYFPETGHNVSGDFWDYYQKTPEADQVFGYPLTEAFTDTTSGRMVQYFTRARFELHPELPEGQQVKLTSLGSKIYTPGTGPNIPSSIGCRNFANGFSVCSPKSTSMVLSLSISLCQTKLAIPLGFPCVIKLMML